MSANKKKSHMKTFRDLNSGQLVKIAYEEMMRSQSISAPNLPCSNGHHG